MFTRSNMMLYFVGSLKQHDGSVYPEMFVVRSRFLVVECCLAVGNVAFITHPSTTMTTMRRSFFCDKRQHKI